MTTKKPSSTRRGTILVVVLVLVAILGFVGLRFVMQLSDENKAVYLGGDQAQVDALVASGEAAIMAMLRKSPEDQKAEGGLLDNPTWFQSVGVTGDAQATQRGRFSVISPKYESDRVTGIRYGISNESARLNLAVLPEWEKQQPGAAREALMSLPEMTEEVADSILDWIDADDEARSLGAEADYYRSESLPYTPRNAVPGCIEELLLVKAVSRQKLLGQDQNQNYEVESGENQAGAGGVTGGGMGSSMDSGAENLPPWTSLLTLYSVEKNVTSDGEPRIDLNDPKIAKLYRDLSERTEEDWARFIILYRQYGPATDERIQSEEAQEVSAPRPRLSQGARFQLQSVLDLVGAKVIVPARSERRKARLVKSPFSEETNAMQEYLPKLLDIATLDRQPLIQGRVNVNLASREVLAAVPSVGEELANRITAARTSLDQESDSQRSPAWLVTEGTVTVAELRQILPYITTGGDAYRAQIVGFFDQNRLFARVELVLDATNELPRRVYWKDLKLLGIGFEVHAEE